MPLNRFFRRAASRALPVVVAALWAGPASAQVVEAVVGITPTCPYGLGACWAGAYASLGRLEGVASVATVPDTYNCTANLRLKGGPLPDPRAWSEQFRSHVGQAYAFRGVEVTVVGTLARKGEELTLQAPGIDRPIPLVALQDKLQWNFKKVKARQPEPDEQEAYDKLVARSKEIKAESLKVQVTGPLRKTDAGMTLEVRESFVLMPGEDPPGRD